MLTITPQCGLCNRLRVVLSALHLSKTEGCAVCVDWGNSAECRAWFEQLFVPIDTGRFRVVHRRWWTRPVTRANLHWPWLVRLLMGYTCQRKQYKPATPDELPALLRRHRRVYVSTPYALGHYTPDCLARLQPCPDIQQRIDRLCARFTRHTVGVHIRRTDNVQSLAESPVEAFRHAMDAEISRNFRVTFYLATDDDALKRQLMQEYPDRIITQRTAVRRDTLEGMTDAVVDLWCLAATRKLLGSYWSSFTDTAAELGGIPLEVVRRRPTA